MQSIGVGGGERYMQKNTVHCTPSHPHALHCISISYIVIIDKSCILICVISFRISNGDIQKVYEDGDI
jgi:hypothetical protein